MGQEGEKNQSQVTTWLDDHLVRVPFVQKVFLPIFIMSKAAFDCGFTAHLAPRRKIKLKNYWRNKEWREKAAN
jgi:hypothetical protein